MLTAALGFAGAISPRTGQRIANATEALGNAVNAGLGTYYGYWVSTFKASMFDLIGEAVNGNGEHISAATLKAAAKRILISHMRLGFYDAHLPTYPFKRYLDDNTTWSLLDSPQHRAVAREVAAKSAVLLKNEVVAGGGGGGGGDGGSGGAGEGAGSRMLPLSPAGTTSIAVVGPFAACFQGTKANPADPRYLDATTGICYLHSYNGNPSNITSIYGGIAEAVDGGIDGGSGGGGGGSKVTYSLGANNTCPKGGGAVGEVNCTDPASPFYYPPAAAAVTAAAGVASAADVTVLVLGLGGTMEAEGRQVA